MVYNEFLETMKKQMELALGDGYSLTLRKVQKNNSLILDGLCIEKDGSPVAPSIYLNPFYEHYLDFTRGLLNLADLTFFVSITGLFLFLTVRHLERRRIS